MLFIKILRLDRLTYSIKQFISLNLGTEFSETPVFNFKHIQDDLNNKNVLIFISSPGSDPVNIINNMAINCNKKDRFYSLSLGNSQESIATK